MDGPSPASISPLELHALIGTEAAPAIIDVRRDAAFAADDRMLVSALRRAPDAVARWGGELSPGRPVVVYCAHGHEVSQGVAAALGATGIDARYWRTGSPGGPSSGCRCTTSTAAAPANG